MVAALFVLLAAGPARGATEQTVDEYTDDASTVTTLRNALTQATDPSSNIIHFLHTKLGYYNPKVTLTNGSLSITTPVTLNTNYADVHEVTIAYPNVNSSQPVFSVSSSAAQFSLTGDAGTGIVIDASGNSSVTAISAPTSTLNIGAIGSNVTLKTKSTASGYGEATGLYAAGDILVASGLAGTITSTVTGTGAAYGLRATDGISITGGLSANITSTAGVQGYAYGLFSLGAISITGGVSGDIAATGGGNGSAYGLYASDGITIAGGLSGAITVKGEGSGSVHGLYGSGGITITEGLSSTITATGLTGSSGSVHGLNASGAIAISGGLSGQVAATAEGIGDAYGLKGAGITITGGLSGTNTVAATAKGTGDAYGLSAGSGTLSITGGLSGSVAATANGTGNAYGLKGTGITISGGLSGTNTVAATANGTGNAYGLSAGSGTLSITGGLSGSVAATATSGKAYGLYAGGNINGGDASTPLTISGSVTAKADNTANAYAIYATGSVNLSVSGAITATNGSAFTFGGYAIYAAGSNNVITLTNTADLGDSWIHLGGGTLTLVGENGTFDTITEGTPNLVIGGNGVAASWTVDSLLATFGSLTINSNSSLRITEAVSGVTGNISNSGSLTWDLAADKAYAGVISGSNTGSLTKDGTGTLTLSGANTYSGATTVTAGTLQAGATNTFSSTSLVTVASGATLALDGYSQTIRTLAGAGSVTLGSNASTVLTINDNWENATFSGVISGSGGLTKTGTKTLTLSGTNTYAGPTVVTRGTLQAGATNTFSSNSAVTVDTGGTLALAGYSQTIGGLAGSGSVTLGSNAATVLTVNSGASGSTYMGVISGSGRLVKTGSGTLTLSGSSTYSGITLSAGGTLQTTASLTLGQSVALGTGGGVLDTGANAVTVSGVVSGSGSLTKTGSGVLYLTSANTYAGGTNINGGTVNIVADANLGDASGGLTFNGGTLQIGADIVSSRDVTLNAGGGSFDTNGHDLTLNGPVSGSGGLTKTGSGTLTLSGDAAYTGPTAIQAGALSLGGSCSSSSMAVASGATLNFAPTKTVTYAGVVTGSGHVTKTGDARLTLSGDNSGFTGDWTLAGGTLSISNDNTLGAATASLNFDGGTLATTAGMTIAQSIAVNPGGGVLDNAGNALTLANSLSGSGNLTLTGSGTTNLGASFDGSAYSGTLSVNGGTLHLVDGETLGGTLTITSSGTLNGVGTVGNLNVRGGVSPGNSPGAITVTGDFVQSGSGTYTCQVTPTANDLIAITGNATLSGTISIEPEYTYYNSGTVWTVLTTQTGRVSGTYSTVTYGATPENWIFVPVYSANAVTITLVRQSYSTSSTSSQASLVGVSLDAVAYNATGEMASLIKNLDYSYGTTTGYSSANALTNYALNVLSAEVYDVFSQNVFAAGRLLTAAQHAGLHEGEEGVGQGFASPLEIGPASLASQNNQYGLGLDTTGGGASSLSLGRFGVFVRPIGMRAFQQGSSSQTGYAAVSSGITGGVTYRPTSELTLALAPGFVTQSVNIHSEGSGQGTITDWSLGLLAAYRSGPWHADAGLRGAYNAFRSSRSLPLPSGSYTAKGNWDGWNVNVSTGGGYDFVAGDYIFGPLAAASWQRLHENAFKERGAGTLGQSLRARDTQALNTVLGARVARTFETPAGNVTPEVRLGWSAQWLGESQNIVASFIGSPGSAYQVKSANHAYHSALVDVGVSMRVSSKLTATARAGVELLRPGYESQAASLGLKYTF